MTAMGEPHGVIAQFALLPIGKLAQPPRAALTGQTTSPGIFDVLVLLGRDESLARISAQAAVGASKV
jgi:glutamyl-tRNA synthetase